MKISTGIKAGAIVGGGIGFMTNGESAEEAGASNLQMAKQIATGAAKGALIGGAVGGAPLVVNEALKKVMKGRH